MKRSVKLALFVCVAFIAMVFGYLDITRSDCHESQSCEDVENDMISGEFWTADTVRYQMNETMPNMPPLAADVNHAASQWSEIPYNGGTIDIAFANGGEMSNNPFINDGYNIVGWTDELPWGDDDQYIPAACMNIVMSTGLIIESDIGFNYYAPFVDHVTGGSSLICIRDVATHEFGHFAAGFLDLTNAHQCSSQYSRYSMWQPTSTNLHNREDIECEEVWAMHDVYGLE